MNQAFNYVGASWNSSWSDEDFQPERRPPDVVFEESEQCLSVKDARPSGCGPRPDVSPNGCSGPQISGYSSFFRASCNSHDDCYVTAGAIRSTCDANFKQDMQIQCTGMLGDAAVANCMNAADTVDVAVRTFGGSYFNDAQADMKCLVWHATKDKVCL